MNISDDEWFELQFNISEARTKYGIALPSLPSDDVQVGFTGLSGRPNLRQAFSFYQYLLAVTRIDRLTRPRIMDFGGGWGRVARLLLRETTPDQIVIVERMAFALACIRETGAAFHVVHSESAPPIRDLSGAFDLVFAYSVFSHLSEPYFRN